MNLSAVSHRSLFADCYARNDREIVISIQTGKEITAVNLVFADPYTCGIGSNVTWSGQTMPMQVSRELKNKDVEFFCQANPGYINGNDLVCLAKIDKVNLRKRVKELLFS